MKNQQQFKGALCTILIEESCKDKSIPVAKYPSTGNQVFLSSQKNKLRMITSSKQSLLGT